MQVDVAMILGAIIENEGGSYELPLEVFKRVVEDPTERGIVIDLDAENEMLRLGVALTEDLGLETEDE